MVPEPEASPWQPNVTFEDMQPQMPAAPGISQGTSPWRGNATFDPTQAAAAAAGTAALLHSLPWAQDRLVELIPGPPVAPQAAPGDVTRDPWVSKGVFEAGAVLRHGAPGLLGRPFMQQLGASQSTGPAEGLPSAAGPASSNAAQHSAGQRLSSVAPGEHSMPRICQHIFWNHLTRQELTIAALSLDCQHSDKKPGWCMK